MDEQISMFEMLGEDETPVIPFEKQKRGMKGWVIEIQGIYTRENGFDRNMVGVTTKEVELKADSYTRYNRTLNRTEQWQNAFSTGKGGCRGDGWIGSPKKLYARRPTWRECQEYVKRNHKGDPYEYEIVYTRKNGDACTRICEYEKGA